VLNYAAPNCFHNDVKQSFSLGMPEEKSWETTKPDVGGAGRWLKSTWRGTRRRGLTRREAREVRAVASAGSAGAAGGLLIGVLG
jgi:hypothetical protein